MSESDAATFTVVSVNFMGEPPMVTKVKTCKDEDQALRELDRVILSVIPQDDTPSPVKRAKDGLSAEVHIFNANGNLGCKWKFSVVKTTRSTA